MFHPIIYNDRGLTPGILRQEIILVVSFLAHRFLQIDPPSIFDSGKSKLRVFVLIGNY